MRKTKKLVDIRYAKGSKYEKILKEIDKEKVCPFCPEHFKWHTKPILKTYGNWLVTENFNPYKDAQYHFVIIGKKHKEQLVELTQKDWKEIIRLAHWTIAKFKLKGGGLMMRFGETRYTGATVCHLHAHLIVPKIKLGKTQSVSFPVG